MKKIIIYIITVVVLLIASCAIFFNFNKKEKNSNDSLKNITVAEVAHTIFYAPQYVAFEKGRCCVCSSWIGKKSASKVDRTFFGII